MSDSQANSVIRLLPYQQAFFRDDARVLVGLWCRQAGKDFTTAAKAVDHALRTGQAWYIVSITQRQADETFAKAKAIAESLRRALHLSGSVSEEVSAEYVEHDAAIDQSFRCQARTLHLPGGGKVVALPGRNPDTLAGLTGNVILTEFGLFPNGGYDHWRVVFPLSTRGFRVIAISTPRGKNTKFFELCNDPATYSVHQVDIHRAVADGLVLTDQNGRPTTIEAFRKLYGDEIGWQREYLCQFTGDLEALLKWAALMAAGERPWQKGLPIDVIRLSNDSGLDVAALARMFAGADRHEIGWDVARHKNFSSVWVNNVLPGGKRSLRTLVLMQECSFALQRSVISALMDACDGAVGCGDATGLGMDSNETLCQKYPGRWEGVTFTAASKREMGSLLRTAFDDGDQSIPDINGPHKFIATDLYALQMEAGSSMRLIEGSNPLLADSHCDIAYSLALARRAVRIEADAGYLWVA